MCHTSWPWDSWNPNKSMFSKVHAKYYFEMFSPISKWILSYFNSPLHKLSALLTVSIPWIQICPISCTAHLAFHTQPCFSGADSLGRGIHESTGHGNWAWAKAVRGNTPSPSADVWGVTMGWHTQVPHCPPCSDWACLFVWIKSPSQQGLDYTPLQPRCLAWAWQISEVELIFSLFEYFMWRTNATWLTITMWCQKCKHNAKKVSIYCFSNLCPPLLCTIGKSHKL